MMAMATYEVVLDLSPRTDPINILFLLNMSFSS
jgi:hypothetical protein